MKKADINQIEDVKLTKSELVSIGKKFLRVRQVHKLTQKEVARETGYSDKYISLVENGRRIPSIELVYWYSKKFEIPVDFFINTGNCSFKKENQNISRQLGLSDKFITELIERQKEHYNLISVLNNIFDTGLGWKFLLCLEDFFVTDGRRWANNKDSLRLTSDLLNEQSPVQSMVTAEDVDSLAEIRLLKILNTIKNILIKKGYSPVDVHVKKKNRKQILKTLKQDNNIEDLDATIFSPKMDEFFDKYFETLWDFE